MTIAPLRKPVMTLYEVERRYILRACATLGWNRKQACKELGISIRALSQKLRQFEAQGYPIGKLSGGRVESE